MDNPYPFSEAKHTRYAIVELIKIARRPMRRALDQLGKTTLEPEVTEQVNTVLRTLDDLETIFMKPVHEELLKRVMERQAARRK